MFDYAERFAQNRIDLAVLRELTNQDFEDLCVVLGDRRESCVRSGRSPARGRPRPPLLARGL